MEYEQEARAILDKLDEDDIALFALAENKMDLWHVYSNNPWITRIVDGIAPYMQSKAGNERMLQKLLSTLADVCAEEIGITRHD